MGLLSWWLERRESMWKWGTPKKSGSSFVRIHMFSTCHVGIPPFMALYMALPLLYKFLLHGHCSLMGAPHSPPSRATQLGRRASGSFGTTIFGHVTLFSLSNADSFCRTTTASIVRPYMTSCANGSVCAVISDPLCAISCSWWCVLLRIIPGHDSANPLFEKKLLDSTEKIFLILISFDRESHVFSRLMRVVWAGNKSFVPTTSFHAYLTIEDNGTSWFCLPGLGFTMLPILSQFLSFFEYVSPHF